MLFDISLSNMFLDMSLQERETKTKINKWDYINLKSFCKGKEIVNKAKGPPTEWEKIFANNISDKGLKYKIYRELIQLNIKKKKTRLKYGQRIWINIFLKKTYRWPTENWKDAQHH